MAVNSPPRIGRYESLAQSFQRTLLAENKSPRTIKTYNEAVRLLCAFLTEKGMPTAVRSIRREHVEEFIADLLSKWKPATANNRYRALQAFFKWLLEEGEINDSTLANMKPPRVPELAPTVLTEEQLRRILKSCEGKGFSERQDTAIIRLLLDSGMRRSECAGLKIADIDFEYNVAVVVGKGSRQRACPFGRKTALALDRYLRIRTHHRTYRLND